MPTVLLRCLDVDRFALADGTEGTAAALAARVPAGAVLHLFLPGPRCLLTSVAVAPHETRLLRRTLPWLLEDAVLEPVEELHVVSGEVEDGRVAVTAIRRDWLAAVLRALADANLPVQVAIPEQLALPWQAGAWTLWLGGEGVALVRHGMHAGFACSRANLPLALQILLNEGAQAPARLAIHAEAGVEFDPVLLPTLLQARVQVVRQTWWQMLAAGPPPAAGNLLQGSFAPPLPWARWWREWRLVAMLLIGLGIADIGMSGLEAWRLDRAAAAAEAELVALYRGVQPEGALVDPRLQLQEAIAGIGGAQPGFLELLGRMAPALQAVPAARVQNLEYDGASGALQVLVETDGFASAENLRASLQQLGLRAELLGSSSDGSGNRTRLRVSG